jgi:transcriptional regulator
MIVLLSESGGVVYVPETFRVVDQADALSLMAANPFAILISNDGDGLMATHMPTLVKQDGEAIVIECHLARPNGHWKRLAANPDTEPLMIFSGPHAYIRPGWYPSKAETGKVVPTWNYAAVHAYGRVQVIEDGAWLLRHVTELTAQQEHPYELPWKPGDAPEQYIAAMLRGIVGIRLSVTRIEAKAKLSQNRDPRDALGAADGLDARGQADDRTIADMIRATRS